jgi:hypothetical protein
MKAWLFYNQRKNAAIFSLTIGLGFIVFPSLNYWFARTKLDAL